MNTDQLIREYRNTTAPNPPSAFLTILIIVGSGVLWLGPPFGLFLIADSMIITLLCCLMVPVVFLFIGVSRKNSIDRKFFDNSKNHSHDDKCQTCGNPNLFGYETSSTYSEQYICRYETGELRKPLA